MDTISVKEDFVLHRVRRGPGDHEIIPIQFPTDNENRHIDTPSTMLQIEGITESNVKSFEKHTRCFAKWYTTSHPVHPVASGGFKASGRNQSSDLHVVIANDAFRGDLLTKLANHEGIPELSIVDLIWAGGDKPAVKAEEKFGDLHIIGHTEGRYFSLFTFHFRQLLVKINLLNQATGATEGSNQAQFNFSTNTTSVTIQPSA